jgi:hypothetical protein
MRRQRARRGIRALGCLMAALCLLAGIGIGIGIDFGHGHAGAASTVLFRFSDPRIDEASGLAVGITSPAELYVQNDSGDSARFFAVNAHTGRTDAVCAVPGASNIDWEDLAVAPDRHGTPSVWLADIGDNDENRSEIRVYRVTEPTVSGAGGALTTAAPQLWRLRYPDGAHNAESIFLDPIQHRIYLVTKSVFGQSQVFQAPASPNPGAVQTMRQVASISFGLTGMPGGPNLVGQLTATGASMSADGSRLVIRTYTDAYFWPVAGGDVAAALRATPTRLALPQQPLGEGIAFRGNNILIDSEGVGSTVYELPVPALGQPRSASSSESAPRSSGKASTTSSTRHTNAADATTPKSGTAKLGVVAVALLLVMGLVVAAKVALGRRGRR